MNSKYRIISKHFTSISFKIQMNTHRNKLSDCLNALFPKTLHPDNSNISVYWQEKVRAFLHAPRGAWQAVPHFLLTQCLPVILREFSLVLGGKITRRTWGGLEMTQGRENCCKLQMQFNFSVLCKGPTIFAYITLSSLQRQRQCPVPQLLCR